jgi:hypothetical protein
VNDKAERQQKIQLATQSIENIVSQCGVLALRAAPALTQAINMARGMKQLRDILTESAILSDFMPLQNTTLGFLTDKPAGYDWETVRDVLIEALLRGFRPINNEYNIMSGRFYGAKNGFDRITHEYPGVQNLQVRLGVPQLAGEKGALVSCEARWLIDGKPMTVKCVPAKGDDFDSQIPVKVNSGMGPDAILGKATRKLYARVYQVLTGCSSDIVENDFDLIPVESLPAPAEAAQDGRRIKMNGGAKREEHNPETGEFPPGNVISD